MFGSFGRLAEPIFQVRREEWRKCFLMFLYFALTISSLYILKPIRNSLFLSVHGAASLRYAYVGEGLFLVLITFLYVELSKKITRKNILFTITTAIYFSNVLVFWLLLRAGYMEWLAYLFYIWVAAYSITIVTQFWTLANDIFNPDEAKRLFGLIASGGSLGGILGGLVTNRAAQKMGTENLLLLAGLILLLCMVLINLIWAYEHPSRLSDRAEKAAEASPRGRLSDKSTWKLFFGSRYLLLIAAIIAISKIASAVVDNQFNSVVEASIHGKNARTAFFGGFLAFLNGVSLLMQLLIASPILRTFGVGFSLLMLPMGLSLGAGISSFVPILGFAAATKIYDGSLNYSINQMGKEILYLPISSRIRYRVKPIIDMLIYRSSKSVAGLLIIAFSLLLGIPNERLGIIILLLVPFWAMAVWGARDEYKHAIQELLVGRGKRKEGGEGGRGGVEAPSKTLEHFDGGRSYGRLKTLLNHRSSVARKISATACLAFHSSARNVNRVKKLAREMARYEALDLKDAHLGFLSGGQGEKRNGVLDQYLFRLLKDTKYPSASARTLVHEEQELLTNRLSEVLGRPEEDTSDQRKAILILSVLGTQAAVDILLNTLAAAEDHSLRFNLIAALNRIRAKGERRQFSSGIIKKEILSEIENHETLRLVLRECRAEKAQAPRLKDDCLLVALEALREESLERIFRLLALLYASDIIHVIYDRLVELGPDKVILANALELLENVVEPEFARKLRPLFKEGVPCRAAKAELENTVRRFLKSRDRWLILCAVFLISELGLTGLFQELRKEAYSCVPLVREAVEIVLPTIEKKQSRS